VKARPRLLVAFVLAAAIALTPLANAQSLPIALFDRYLDSLRAGIPGLSAVIVQDGQIVWERGYGHRDVEAALPATPDTPYPIADLTQTFAAVLVLQCVERGYADLDEPMSKWWPSSADPDATLRQMLAHAFGGPASLRFRYNPSRFAQLGPVIELCGRRPARTTLTSEIIDPLVMLNTVPGRDVVDLPEARSWFSDSTLDRYRTVLRQMAVPYRVDRRGKATRGDLPSADLTASMGLIASARDLARFDAALDDRFLLDDETLAMSWTNLPLGSAPSPTGLGWFVQQHEGQRLVWHFGNAPEAYSSLILKIPAKRLTLILLANSDGLSAPFDLSQGDVTTSLFAQAFLRLFL
jgi:CubicO group peptidase (beta-lactamase class C family)